ncbi:MAG: acyl-CoA dehydrogenase family protein [Rhizobiaceae bacterium]
MIRDEEMLTLFVDTVSRFVKERLVPSEECVADEDKVPDELIEEMRQMGLFGISIPEEYGGMGFTLEEEVMIAIELGKTSPAFRSVFGTNVGIGSQALVIDGTEAQKTKYLPLMATGEFVGSFALTEPDVGSDAGAVKTTAKLVEGGYLINGTKRFITNAPSANLFTVMARTNENEPGARGVSAFIVDADLKGISIGKPEKKMGQHGTYVSDVIFSDCEVPRDALIGGREGVGFKTAMKVLDRGRIHIAAVCVGIANRLINDSIRYATERRQFGKPIAEHQLIQALIADSVAEQYAAQTMVIETARRHDDGKQVKIEAASSKMFASEMVGRVADRAVQIFGGAGYVAEYGIERFYRDVRLFRIYEGTTQIQQLVIAREAIKKTMEVLS